MRIVMIALFLVSVGISGVASSPDDYATVLQEGMTLAYNLRSEQAAEKFEQLIRLDADNPLGYALQAVNAYYTFRFDSNNKDKASRFEDLAQRTIDTCQKLINKNREDEDALFFLGTAHIYLGSYHLDRQNWTRAFWYGRKGLAFLQRTTELNPGYYDAYLGLGAYHYYADILPGAVKTVSSWLGVEADRRRGLRELREAASQGAYAKVEASLFLGFIYLFMENEPENARQVFDDLARQYPGNAGFLLMLGESQRRSGLHDQAIATLSQVAQTPIAQQLPYFAKNAAYYLGRVYYDLDDHDQTVTNLHNALADEPNSPKEAIWYASHAHFLLAETYELMGMRDRAVAGYKKVRKDRFERTYKLAQERIKQPLLLVDQDLIRAQKAFNLRHYDKAMQFYLEALAKITAGEDGYPPEKYAESLWGKARVLYGQHQYDAAITDLRQVIDHKPDRPDWLLPWSYFYLAECYRSLGKLAEAEAAYDTAARYDDKFLRIRVDKAREKMGSR